MLLPISDSDRFLPRDAVLARYVLWSCVCPSVCHKSGVLSKISKRLNVGSCKQRRTIAQGFYFSDAKDFSEIPVGSPLTVAPKYMWVMWKVDNLWPVYHCISETVQDRDTVTMEG